MLLVSSILSRDERRQEIQGRQAVLRMDIGVCIQRHACRLANSKSLIPCASGEGASTRQCRLELTPAVAILRIQWMRRWIDDFGQCLYRDVCVAMNAHHVDRDNAGEDVFVVTGIVVGIE